MTPPVSMAASLRYTLDAPDKNKQKPDFRHQHLGPGWMAGTGHHPNSPAHAAAQEPCSAAP